MDYQTYRLLHILAAFFLFSALGGLVVAAVHNDARFRKIGSITHGISMILLLVSGFGLMARLGIDHSAIPAWAWLKLGIWVALGACMVAIKRMQNGRWILWLALPLLGGVAAYLGLFHPPVG